LDFTAANVGHCASKQTRVIFSCPRSSAGPIAGKIGSPRLVSEDSEGCKTEIEWETSAACPVGKATSGQHCKVTDAVGVSYDLSPIVGQTFEAHDSTDSATTYKVAICSDVEEGGACATSAACQLIGGSSSTKHSMGKIDSVLQVSGDRLTLEYTGGEKCHDSQFTRKTKIDFVCSETITSPSEAKLVFQQEFADCTYYFELETPLACAAVAEVVEVPCTATDPDDPSVTYDLSALMHTDAQLNYIASDAAENNEFKYFVNVCRSLTPTSRHGCDADAAVCQVVSEGGDGVAGAAEQHSLGTPSSPTVSDGKLTIRYDGGDPTGCPAARSSVIEFVCDADAGENSIPKFMDEFDPCVYSFVWNTPHACSDKVGRPSGTPTRNRLLGPGAAMPTAPCG
jgi:hypothetical protein